MLLAVVAFILAFSLWHWSPWRADDLAAKSARETPAIADPDDPSTVPNLSTANPAVTLSDATHGEASSPGFEAHLPAGYVGTARCAECHPSQFQSYNASHHSRSLSLWTPDTEVPTGQISHASSKSIYSALESSGKLLHRESLTIQPQNDGPPSEVLLMTAELPVKYIIGSGAFAQGYLLQDDSFLVQSPMTWYVKPKCYAMAPGYEDRHQIGMTRVISDTCLFCHAGNVSRVQGNNEILAVSENAIGCERCHGPGQAHVAHFENVAHLNDVDPSDLTVEQAESDAQIVHPGRLSRDLADAICAQCHLQGDLEVAFPGKTPWDFRPGERLDATRVSYKVDESGKAEKTFVNHFDQIWQSQCFLKSDSLKCISCHDPHHNPSNRDVTELQRSYCIQCHEDSACGLPIDDRIAQAQNHCVECHMPRVDSEIPHTATTHHRIGVHENRPVNPAVAGNVGDAPVETVRRLQSPVDAASDGDAGKRSDLLARSTWFLNKSRFESDEEFLSESRSLSPLRELIAYAKVAPDDTDVLVAIASLARLEAEWLVRQRKNTPEQEFRRLWQVARAYAERVVQLDEQPDEERKKALDVLFAVYYDAGQYADAARVGSELVAIGRSAQHFYNLGLAMGKLRRFSEAEQAFQEAIRIDGNYLPPYLSLIKIYEHVDPAIAEQIRATAFGIQKNLTEVSREGGD